MLAQTAGGDAYTFAELRGMLEDSGCREVTRHDLHGPQTLIVGTK